MNEVKFTGTISGLSVSPDGKKTIVTIETEQPAKDFEELMNKEKLKCSASPYTRKRSLSANAYFHVLCGNIAKAMGLSMSECKNFLMSEYGVIDINSKTGSIMLRDFVDWKKHPILHLCPTGRTYINSAGNLFYFYLIIKPSHLYTTDEMARLINGTVSEAEALGIPTKTRKEVDDMLSHWKPTLKASDPF